VQEGRSVPPRCKVSASATGMRPSHPGRASPVIMCGLFDPSIADGACIAFNNAY